MWQLCRRAWDFLCELIWPIRMPKREELSEEREPILPAAHEYVIIRSISWRDPKSNWLYVDVSYVDELAHPAYYRMTSHPPDVRYKDGVTGMVLVSRGSVWPEMWINGHLVYSPERAYPTEAMLEARRGFEKQYRRSIISAVPA